MIGVTVPSSLAHHLLIYGGILDLTVTPFQALYVNYYGILARALRFSRELAS